MLLRIPLLSVFLLFTSICLAQNSDHIKLLNEKKKTCEDIMGSFSGTSENIEKLITEGKLGLRITSVKDYEYKMLFNNAIGTGYYYKQDFKLAKQHFEQAYDEAVKAKLIEKSLKPLGNLIFIYHYLGLQDKADTAAYTLKKAVDNIDTLKNKGDIYYNLGIYNQQQKFYYGIALSNFLKSVELNKLTVDTAKNLKRKLDYGTKLMMVAEIYLYLKQPNKALQYLNDVKPFLNQSIIVDVSAYGKFVRSYVQLNNKAEALKYYNLLHNAVGAKPGRWSELVSSSLEMANLELKEKDFKQAKFYIDKADKQSKLDNNEVLTSSVNLSYGDYYKAINNYILASKYYKIAEHGSAIYNKEQYADLLKSLAAVEIMLGNKETASSYFNKYISVSDSLNQQKISLNLAEMEAKFQNEYKQQKIGVLNKENDAKSVQLRQEKITRFLLIGGAILLLIALFSIYLNVRNKQKANQLLDKKNKQLDALNAQLNDANQTKTKLFSIISHDLRSPVSQLFTFLKLQQNHPDSILVAEKSDHREKLMQSSKNLLSTMEDLLLWSKSQMDHFELDMEEIGVQELFDETISLMKGQADVKCLIIKVVSLDFEYIVSDQNFLIIILRNLMQNAINASFPKTVINLYAGLNDAKQKYISISNYGEVISENTIVSLTNEVNVKGKSTGYGFFLVKELAEKINASVLITSNKIDGTEVKIVFNV